MRIYLYKDILASGDYPKNSSPHLSRLSATHIDTRSSAGLLFRQKASNVPLHFAMLLARFDLDTFAGSRGGCEARLAKKLLIVQPGYKITVELKGG